MLLKIYVQENHELKNARPAQISDCFIKRYQRKTSIQ